MDLRIKECVRLGIKRVLCPKGVENTPEIELVPLKNVKSLFEYLVTRH